MVQLSHRLVAGRPAIAALVVLWAVIAAPPHAEADPQPCRYDTSSPDTVLDQDTGLTWQMAVDSSPRTFNDANSYCQSLQLSGGGWRLPSIQELQTLIDDSKYAPVIELAAFPDTPGTYFWSSSVSAVVQNDAWFVDFYDGNVNTISVNDTHSVRCVR